MIKKAMSVVTTGPRRFTDNTALTATQPDGSQVRIPLEQVIEIDDIIRKQQLAQMNLGNPTITLFRAQLAGAVRDIPRLLSMGAQMIGNGPSPLLTSEFLHVTGFRQVESFQGLERTHKSVPHSQLSIQNEQQYKQNAVNVVINNLDELVGRYFQIGNLGAPSGVYYTAYLMPNSNFAFYVKGSRIHFGGLDYEIQGTYYSRWKLTRHLRLFGFLRYTL
jgi:hypothetical protein